jgi:CRISPR-associated endonuclease/helicase Cas3
MNLDGFNTAFQQLTGNPPFPWQAKLYERFVAGSASIPPRCDIPTGLGKTSVIAIWLLAREVCPSLPTRLVYVVNRRTVVDQTTDEVERIRENLSKIGKPKGYLAISTLRGQFADNREWSADPSRAAVICGTVDMIGSRLLFSGYGVGFKSKPLHAGFLGQDSLIVHDEAHLEPSFQDLLIAIQKEQREARFPDLHPLRVMELSATSRGNGNNVEAMEPFQLTPADRENQVVKQRIHASKKLHLIPQADPKPGNQLAKIAIDRFKDSGKAVLIFTRTIDDVNAITEALSKAKLSFEQLIGPMRGLERDRLVDTDVFKRFLPTPIGGGKAVFLVCTSAGEVGVNISGYHLVSDLSTFESMAQRGGRVNRFGLHDDSEIYVVHPISREEKKELIEKASSEEKKKLEAIHVFDNSGELDLRRERTLKLLRQLNGNASPDALSKLPESDRIAAFAPTPVILATSDILFDAWSMTSIRDKMPGRPPVEPYLHGIREYEPPETQVAWREEVGVIVGDRLKEYLPEDLEDLLDEYPLKPHELLGDRSDRVHRELVRLAERFPGTPTWIIDESGKVTPIPLDRLAEKSGKELIERKTVLLPHNVGGLTRQGMLDGSFPPETKLNDQANAIKNDVADIMVGASRRLRIWDGDPAFDLKTDGMRRILRIDFPPPEDDEDADRPSWHWFEQPLPKENSKNAQQPVLLDVHVSDVVKHTREIVGNLQLDDWIKKAIVLAAILHDLGKKREIWQHSIGRPARLADIWFGKSGRRWKPRDIGGYRHEFGSLIDLQSLPEFLSLDNDSKNLVLHLIATHHGQGRPHFTPAQTVDPDFSTPSCEAITVEVPCRFARLQRKFGRWGLAYIESLLRAADWAASAAPSEFFLEEAK